MPRADRVEDDMGKEVVEIVTDELLGLHTVKKKSEIFPDYNWIAPCIPAGCGFLSHGYLSNSIWNWIQLYLDSYPTTKNDLN